MAWAAIDPSGPWLAVGCAKAENGLAKQVPGMNFGKADGIWRAPLSWPAYVAFRTVWGSQPVDEHPGLVEWGDQAWARVQYAYELRSDMDAGRERQVWESLCEVERGEQMTGPNETSLFGFQRGGVQWLAYMRRACLDDPQGNGKTPQVIRTLQVLGADQALPALVICAGAALLGWQREFARWAPELRVQIVAGTALRRRQALLESGESDVYLVAWPNVRMHTRLAAYPSQAFVRCNEHGGSTGKTVAQCEVHEKELNQIPFRTIIPDEAHRMGDARSKQTRAVWWLAHHAENFWPVTGTPIADTISNLWPVLHGIDPRAWPERTRYLDLYAIKNMAWHGGTEILDIRPDTAAAFHASVQPLIRRIPKELARPEMPKRLPPVFRYPEMTPAQAKAYRQLKKESLAELDGQVIVPGNTAVRFGRMCQLAGSLFELRDGEDSAGFSRQQVELVLPSSKADDLLDFLGDNPGPLVVAANSPPLVALCERKLAAAKITHTKIVGGMSYEQQDQAVQWFQNGDSRVIFITKAGSESVTLTAADTIFFIQPDPSFLGTEQKIGRIDRIGQKSPVRVVYSISPGTVDERLYKLSTEKAERANSLTQDAGLLRWMIKGDDDDVEKAQRPAPEQGQQPLF
jgi:SNF2 family DNA or RNA helicase